MMFGAKLLGYLGMGMGARAGMPIFETRDLGMSGVLLYIYIYLNFYKHKFIKYNICEI